MQIIRLLMDMNISPQTVQMLRQQGWNAIRVSDVLPSNTPDNIILDWAIQHQYTLVSQDLDFSGLVALSGLAKPSLITLRLNNSAPHVVTERLLQTLTEISELLDQGYAITVKDKTIRVRQLPIP